MRENDLKVLFDRHLWEKLANLYSPNEIVQRLSFKNSLLTAYCLLYNDEWDEKLQEYSVQLLYEIEKYYSEDWAKSWEFDALLGLACYITYKHEERYKAYKKAFDKTNSPPPRLLIELARCCICPGPPPITYDQAVNLVSQAIKEKLYTDGVSVLCNIYSTQGNEKMKQYWTDVLKTLAPHTESPSIDPSFLEVEYLKIVEEKKRSVNPPSAN